MFGNVAAKSDEPLSTKRYAQWSPLLVLAIVCSVPPTHTSLTELTINSSLHNILPVGKQYLSYVLH